MTFLSSWLGHGNSSVALARNSNEVADLTQRSGYRAETIICKRDAIRFIPLVAHLIQTATVITEDGEKSPRQRRQVEIHFHCGMDRWKTFSPTGGG
jgi:hypothetical protein